MPITQIRNLDPRFAIPTTSNLHSSAYPVYPALSSIVKINQRSKVEHIHIHICTYYHHIQPRLGDKLSILRSETRTGILHAGILYQSNYRFRNSSKLPCDRVVVVGTHADLQLLHTTYIILYILIHSNHTTSKKYDRTG